MKQCFWIRHAPIEPTGKYTGQSDVDAILPPSPAHGYHIPANAVHFVSPLKRAVQTAQWLMPDRTFTLAPELKEQHFGAWEGQFYDDVWQEARHSYDWSKPEHLRPEGGESFADLCTRVDAWLDKTLPDHYALVIVAHAGTIRAGLRHALKLSHADALNYNIDNVSMTHIVYEGDTALVRCVNFSML